MSDFRGHNFRRTTRVQDTVYYVCKSCGINVKVFDWPRTCRKPQAVDLDQKYVWSDCEDIQVRQVMDS
jgi:hypothetical protein